MPPIDQNFALTHQCVLHAPHVLLSYECLLYSPNHELVIMKPPVALSPQVQIFSSAHCSDSNTLDVFFPKSTKSSSLHQVRTPVTCCKDLLTLGTNHTMKGTLYSAVRGYLFITFTSALSVWGPSTPYAENALPRGDEGPTATETLSN
jgi:hypothetical protein